MKTFEDLGLDAQLLAALTEAGYTIPTQIQAEAIPLILQGADLRASAQTGTGKTAAFLLPALHRLATVPAKDKEARLLVLAPTRELAMQISSQVNKYCRFLPHLKTICLFGGEPIPIQVRKLKKPHSIIIATPGRLIDFLERGRVNLSRIEMLVLDEADRMLDMGFVEPVKQIAAKTPKSRQTLLFSATLEGSIKKLSEQLLKDPKELKIEPDTQKPSLISQKLHFADSLEHKNRLLEHVLRGENVRHTIVFTSTKRHAEQLTGELTDLGFKSGALHGDMSQKQRTRTIARLRKGEIEVLVATDVAARGIDVQSITHIVNFDLPHNVEDYVHRIGRTGRAGATGTAVSLVSRRDALFVKKIEKYTGQNMLVEQFPGLEPREKAQKPPRKRRFHRQRRPQFASA